MHADSSPAMAEVWKDHCSISEEKHPVKRQAWKGGWMYREEHGPSTSKLKIAAEIVEDPDLRTAWLKGFTAADSYLSDAESGSPKS